MEQERKLSFEEYKEEVWLPRHQASIPTEETARSPYPSWSRAAAIIGFFAAALISGVHVVPSVYAGIPEGGIVPETLRVAAAYGSFVAYELGMFMAAFLMSVETTKRLARIMTGIIFVTLILVNLNSVIEVYGLNMQDNLIGAGVSLAFALVPMIAYASGKFFINIEAGERAAERKAKEAVREANVRLDAIINAAYTKYTKEYDERLEKARERLSVQQGTDVRTDVYTVNGGVQGRTNVYTDEQGVRTKWTAKDLAERLVQDGFTGTIDAIQREYGASRGTAQNARKIVESMNGAEQAAAQ